MKIKQRSRGWLTQTISSILTIVMILTMFPTTVFAYTGDGTGDEGFTDGSKWRANWNSNQIGVRVSIVNHNGENVLINSETSKPYVVDILFSQPQGNTMYLSGNKFQDFDGDGSQDILFMKAYKLNDYINEAIKANPAIKLSTLPHYDTWPSTYSGLPVPIKQNSNGDWVGNGKEVKEFFIKGKQGDFTPNYTPTINIFINRKRHFTCLGGVLFYLYQLF